MLLKDNTIRVFYYRIFKGYRILFQGYKSLYEPKCNMLAFKISDYVGYELNYVQLIVCVFNAEFFLLICILCFIFMCNICISFFFGI